MRTPKEVAREFAVTSKTVLEWFHNGIIPAEVAVGKVFRFDLDRVRAALAKHAKKGGRK